MFPSLSTFKPPFTCFFVKQMYYLSLLKKSLSLWWTHFKVILITNSGCLQFSYGKAMGYHPHNYMMLYKTPSC